jgi:hypothetical protein
MNGLTRKTLAALLTLAMILTMACGIVNTLTGGSSGTVASLWPDVPPLDGATLAKLDLPLAAKLAVQAMFQGKLEFVSYTSSKTIPDIQAFYSADRMKQSGWTSDTGGCTGGANNSGAQGAFCFYSKTDTGKDIGLAIIMAQDDKTKESQIFYVRIDVTPTPTPAK